jgi:hypothetical protein
MEERRFMKFMIGAIVLACAPLGFAGNNGAYPTEKISAFVIEQLDVTTLPAELRPKREKGKKTFGDYGYVTRDVNETGELVDASQGTSRFTLRVLERTSEGIFVCANGQIQKAANAPFQRVLLLKRKDESGLLKSRESWKEYQGCPVTGGVDAGADTSSY